MGKRKILFLCQQPLWPTNTGARLRNFHLADVLCSAFDVTVLQAVDPATSIEPPPASSFHSVLSASRDKSYTAGKIVRGMLGPLPLTVLNYVSSNVERLLLRTLDAEPFAAVQIENIHMAPYIAPIRRHFKKQGRTTPFILLDWHNIESELARQYGKRFSNPAKRLVAGRTADLIHDLEQNSLKQFSAHTVVSDLERDRLLSRDPAAEIHVIPNGVDSAVFETIRSCDRKRRVLLFVGSMDYHANSEAVVWFTREIWPQLAHELPELDFKIVGRNPPPSVQALASPRIFVTGTVSDVKPYYQEAFAVVVPLRVGGGTRLKILEAMAAGVPVISTRLGAEGIEALDRQTILLADTAADMASAIRALINEPGFGNKLSDAARLLVQTQYDWRVVGEKLAQVYQALPA